MIDRLLSMRGFSPGWPEMPTGPSQGKFSEVHSGRTRYTSMPDVSDFPNRSSRAPACLYPSSRKDRSHRRRIEVFVEPLDPAFGEVHDEACRKLELLSARARPVQKMALHEAAREELARLDLVAAVRNARDEQPEQP